MYNQILIHFHIQPLLWMSIHCESTSRNHRTELPYEHWEQHHCTGRNQPCSLCNTNHYCQFQFLTSHQLPSLSILHESVFRCQNIRSTYPSSCSIFLKRLHRDLGPGFDSMPPARIIMIARLVSFDELQRRNLSEILRLPSFLMLVKQCEDPSVNTLLPILQSKFGSGESEPFAYFQRMKPRTTTTENMNGSFLTWNLTIFFCPIPRKTASILTPNSRDWWTNTAGKGPYLPMSFQSQGSGCVCYRAVTTTRS